MSLWAWAFLGALTWLVGRFLWRHRRTIGLLLGKWLPRRVQCVFIGHRWGHGVTASNFDRFLSFSCTCLRCGTGKRIELHRSPSLLSRQENR